MAEAGTEETYMKFICNECPYYTYIYDEMATHIQTDHHFQGDYSALRGTSVVFEREDQTQQHTATTELSDKTEEKTKIWTRANTEALINFVREHEDEFDNKVKKRVWETIATKINNKTKANVTWLQCDTKWKGLTKMYKDVKKHNETSGNNIKEWQYYEALDEILNKRPEINPVATCSSNRGLLLFNKDHLNIRNKTIPVMQVLDDSDEVEIPAPAPTASAAGNSKPNFKSKFMTRRRNQNKAERRHQEKLQRQDRYLELLERLVKVAEQKHRNNVQGESAPSEDE